MKNHSLPIKGVTQGIESDDEDTKECSTYCIKASDNTDINLMRKLKTTNHKGSRRL